MKSVSHNVELAEKQIVFAEENIDRRPRRRREARGSPGAAVAAIRAAEGPSNRRADCSTRSAMPMDPSRRRLPDCPR